MDIGENSATDMGALDIDLSDRELYYLRAAGIPPHLLNNNDRAAVIRSLMVDNELIEDGRAGGAASLVYNMGALRDMLSHSQTEIEKEEKENAAEYEGLTPEERIMKRAGYSRQEILARRQYTREETLLPLNLTAAEPVKVSEEVSVEEERLLEREAAIFRRNEKEYAKNHPLPDALIGILQMVPLAMIAKDAPAMAEGGTAIQQDASQPTNTPDLQKLAAALGGLKIPVSALRDDDPTHLTAPLVTRKIHHEPPPLPPLPGHKSDK